MRAVSDADTSTARRPVTPVVPRRVGNSALPMFTDVERLEEVCRDEIMLVAENNVAAIVRRMAHEGILLEISHIATSVHSGHTNHTTSSALRPTAASKPPAAGSIANFTTPDHRAHHHTYSLQVYTPATPLPVSVVSRRWRRLLLMEEVVRSEAEREEMEERLAALTAFAHGVEDIECHEEDELLARREHPAPYDDISTIRPSSGSIAGRHAHIGTGYGAAYDTQLRSEYREDGWGRAEQSQHTAGRPPLASHRNPTHDGWGDQRRVPPPPPASGLLSPAPADGSVHITTSPSRHSPGTTLRYGDHHRYFASEQWTDGGGGVTDKFRSMSANTSTSSAAAADTSLPVGAGTLYTSPRLRLMLSPTALVAGGVIPKGVHVGDRLVRIGPQDIASVEDVQRWDRAQPFAKHGAHAPTKATVQLVFERRHGAPLISAYIPVAGR